MAVQKSSFRIEQDNLYIIEVNDKGETIEFDLDDVIGLQNKLLHCYSEIDKIRAEFEAKAKELQNKEYEEEKEGELPQREIDLVNITTEFYQKSRACMDIFLGKNGCQKIFGDRNFPTMFEKLFEKLQPDIQKMGLSIKNMQKNLVNKYKNTSNRKVIK